VCKSEATIILVIHPQFSKTFLLEYRFEEIQTLRFVVYDVDDRKRVEDARRHDLIGEMECTLADIVTGGQLYKRTLRMKGASRGQIMIQAEEVQDSKYNIHMQLSASKLDKKDFFGKVCVCVCVHVCCTYKLLPFPPYLLVV